MTQGRFDEADKLSAGIPLDKPSVEVSAELRALGDWHAANGHWPEAAARFESVIKVNQLDAAELVSEDQLKLAAAFLKSGNRQGYEQFRQTEVAKLGPINIASEYQTFKAGLLLPPDPNLMQLFVLGAELSKRDFRMRKSCAQTRLIGRNGRRSWLCWSIGRAFSPSHGLVLSSGMDSPTHGSLRPP